MEDLGLVAELFKTSSTLAKAADSLDRMQEEEEQLDPTDLAALTWAGKFLSAVDWTAQQQGQQPVGGGLALQATSVRPTFYSCLFRMAPQLRDEGVQNEQELTSFLSSLYRNLQSPGAPGRGHRKLSPGQSRLGSALLHQMAESILVQINNNGLPRPSATLKDEWKPTANELTPAFA